MICNACEKEIEGRVYLFEDEVYCDDCVDTYTTTHYSLCGDFLRSEDDVVEFDSVEYLIKDLQSNIEEIENIKIMR